MEANQQAMLFVSSTRNQDDLTKAVDRIRDKYGFEAIKTGRAIQIKDI